MSFFDLIRLFAYGSMAFSGAYIAIAFRKAYFSKDFPMTRSLAVISGVLSFYGFIVMLALLGARGIFEVPGIREILTLPVLLLAGTLIRVAFLVRGRVKYLKDRSMRE